MRFLIAVAALTLALAQQQAPPDPSCAALADATGDSGYCEDYCEPLCVRVDPAACSGGTVDYSTLTTSSRLLVTTQHDGLIRAADLGTLTWTQCADNASFPVPRDECPADHVSPTGEAVMHASWLVILCLGTFACCCGHRGKPVDERHFPGVKWEQVAFIWLVDFWVAVNCSMQAQQISFGTVGKILLGLVFTVLAWDVPLKVLQLCCRGRCRCAAALGVYYGMIMCGGACNKAYSPSDIAVLGHYPLVLGLLNFALGVPKAVAKDKLKHFFMGKPEHYVLGYSEVVAPAAGFFYPPKAEEEETTTKLLDA